MAEGGIQSNDARVSVYIIFNEENETASENAERIITELSKSNLNCVFFSKDGRDGSLETQERARLISIARWIVVLWDDWTKSGPYTYELFNALYFATETKKANILYVLPENSGKRLPECFPYVYMKPGWTNSTRTYVSEAPKELSDKMFNEARVAEWVFQKFVDKGGNKLSCPARIHNPPDRRRRINLIHWWEKTYVNLLYECPSTNDNVNSDMDPPEPVHDAQLGQAFVSPNVSDSEPTLAAGKTLPILKKVILSMYFIICIYSIVDLSILFFRAEFTIYFTIGLVVIDLILIVLNAVFYWMCAMERGLWSYLCSILLIVPLFSFYFVCVYTWSLDKQICSFVMFLSICVGGAAAHARVYFAITDPSQCRSCRCRNE